MPELTFTDAELDRLADSLAERVRERVAARAPSGRSLLTVIEAAKVLGCHPATVRRRIAEGAIPAMREGERVVVRADELEAYVERLARVGAKPPGWRGRRTSRDLGLDFLRE